MADVELTIKINENYAAAIVSAIDVLSGVNITLNANRHTPFEVQLPEKTGLTKKQYAQKIARALFLGVARMAKKTSDVPRYNTEIAALLPPQHNIPDGSIE